MQQQPVPALHTHTSARNALVCHRGARRVVRGWVRARSSRVVRTLFARSSRVVRTLFARCSYAVRALFVRCSHS